MGTEIKDFLGPTEYLSTIGFEDIILSTINYGEIDLGYSQIPHMLGRSLLRGWGSGVTRTLH